MFVDITSSQNPHVKRAVRLRTRRGREKQQRIIIDGSREILRAIQANVEIERVFVSRDRLDAEATRDVLDALAGSSALIHPTDPHVASRLAYGQRADLVATAKTPIRRIDQLTSRRDPLVAVLEGVEKPGNVGAILRSADGAGLDAVIVVDAGTDLFNPNAIRASLGTIFSLPVCAATLDEVQAWLQRHCLQVLLAQVDGAVHYTSVDYRKPTAIVLGSEATGLSSRWKQFQHQAIALPMLGVADSLNVAAAAAVLFYEARRQRDCG